MKKIYLMPLEAKPDNYGGLLQEYALQEECKKLGFDVTIINDVFLERRSVFSVKSDIRNFSFAWLLSKIKEKKARKDNRLSEENKNHLSERRKKIDLFRKEYMQFSAPCKQTELEEIVHDGFAVIVGSDQVWNPAMTSYPLFLDFVKSQRKIAYAASISRDSLTKREQHILKPLIDDFDYVSLREERGKELLDSFCSIDCTVVLDPTMLVESSIWHRLTQKRVISEKYVFCYFLGGDIKIREEARAFATYKGLELVTIPLLKKENLVVDESYDYVSFIEASPVDFLNLVRYAEYVVTDSFHAVVFSLIFNRPFFVTGREMAGHTANSRLSTLLGYFDLTARMSFSDKLVDIIDDPIDYTSIEKKLSLLRQNSEGFLLNALKE